MEWLLSHRPLLLEDKAIQQYIKKKGSVIAQATAAVSQGNLAWAKTARSKILPNGAWDRRAYLYALSALSGDERKNLINRLLRHPAMTVTDLWAAS